MPRIFTVEQANQLLPRVRSLLSRLRKQRDAVRARESAVVIAELEGLAGQELLSHTARRKVGEQAEQWSDEMEKLNGVLSRLDALGCQLKDMDEGLIDFFTIHQGQLVYLCWKDGEEAVRFWHGLEDGFTGRRPITELANN